MEISIGALRQTAADVSNSTIVREALGDQPGTMYTNAGLREVESSLKVIIPFFLRSAE